MENLDAEGFNTDARETIKTFTGKYVNPWIMTTDDVCVEDVAHSNSNECRFSGHSSSFWSVAQHELLVAGLLIKAGFSQYAVAGLTHDAGEAYAKDMPSPIKHHDLMSNYRGMERRCGAVASRALGVTMPLDTVVKAADIFARRVEQIAFMGSTADPASFDQRFSFAFARRMIHWLSSQGPPAIENHFLATFAQLSGDRKVGLWLP